MTARRKSLLDPADSRWDREVTLNTKDADGSDRPYTYTHYNRDDIRRHLMSVRMLEHLLKRARVEDLPAMSTWLVTPFSVVGEITTMGGPDPVGCREAFMEWAHALELEHVDDKPAAAGWWRESRYDGRVELIGACKLPARAPDGHLEVSVQVRATWWTDQDEAESVTVPADAAGQSE